jgi:hypothetical protein
MSEHKVDLGQIRGDWDFHCRYVTNAMEQTLKRLQKSWRVLKANAPAAGQVPMSGPLMEDFLEACRQTRALTDDIQLMTETQPARAPAAGRRSAKRSVRAAKTK